MTYLSHLLETAYTIPSKYTKTLPKIHNPELFLSVILEKLDPTKVTMNGLDNMLDIIFAHEDMSILLTDLSCQSRIEIPPTMEKYWTHIIIPAWNQHAEIQEAKIYTSHNNHCIPKHEETVLNP